MFPLGPDHCLARRMAIISRHYIVWFSTRKITLISHEKPPHACGGCINRDTSIECIILMDLMHWCTHIIPLLFTMPLSLSSFKIPSQQKQRSERHDSPSNNVLALFDPIKNYCKNVLTRQPVAPSLDILSSPRQAFTQIRPPNFLKNVFIISPTAGFYEFPSLSIERMNFVTNRTSCFIKMSEIVNLTAMYPSLVTYCTIVTALS